MSERGIVKGSIWRRRKTGALLRIASVRNVGTDHRPYLDIAWEAIERPRRRGQCYEDYWLRNCELATPTPSAAEVLRTEPAVAPKEK